MFDEKQTLSDERKSEYVAAQEAAKILGVKPAKLYYYAEREVIRREPGRGHKKFRYNVADLLALKSKLRARRRQDTPELRWMTPRDLPGVLKLDLEVFDHALVGDYSTYAPWLTKNPYIAMAAFSGERCLAYISMLPLPEPTILDVLSGTRDELSIRDEEILTYEEPGEYTLLANSVVINPERPELLYALLGRVMEHWTDQYPERQVARIFAQAASESGDILIQKLFMAPLYRTVENTMLPIHNAYVLDLRRAGATRVIRSFQEAIKRKGAGLQVAPSVVSGLPSFTAPGVEVASSRVAPRQKTEPASPPNLPEGSKPVFVYAREVGIARRRLVDYMERYHLEHIAIPNPKREGESERYLTPEQQEHVRAWLVENGKLTSSDL
ncbi:hypothetical protein [Ktedonospora formicarum]|uniref:Uncharacterized protein n=1 Tax=Ktedonospora formicarum TaxID=2778364 RepID=A0A8J3I6Z5_9CHLR|nr:hypothetical protein [Ktedonospora formicarum]GHO51512.1 hypothetical protein KSX_96750 [Ktedonospora formicarum]